MWWVVQSHTSLQLNAGARSQDAGWLLLETFLPRHTFIPTSSQFSPFLCLEETICKSHKALFGETSWTYKPFATSKQICSRITAPGTAPCPDLSHNYPESPGDALAPKTKGQAFASRREAPENHVLAKQLGKHTQNVFILLEIHCAKAGFQWAQRQADFDTDLKKKLRRLPFMTRREYKGPNLFSTLNN